MKTKAILGIILTTILTLTGSAQESPKRFGFEFSTGASMATQKLAGSTLNPGFGFEAIILYSFMPRLAVYGGWGWNRFGADESFAGNDANFEETGYVLGLQLKQPIADSRLSWYLRAGGLYGHIETENSSGDVIHDTGHGLGWQLAGGIDVALGNNWSLTPGVKFNALTRNSDFEETPKSFKHDYASVRIGLLKKF
jgi:hypothetical protein